MTSHERGKDREAFMTSGTHQWPFVTRIFHNSQPSDGGVRKSFEVMISTSDRNHWFSSLINVYSNIIAIILDTFMTGWFNYTKEMTAAVHDKSVNIIQVLYEDLLMVKLPFSHLYTKTITCQREKLFNIVCIHFQPTRFVDI